MENTASTSSSFFYKTNQTDQADQIKKRQFKKTARGRVLFATKDEALSYVPMKKNALAIIPQSVIEDVFLSNFSKILYGKILGICKENKIEGCVYSNTEIEKDFCIAQRTAVRTLHLLEKNGYIDIFYLMEKTGEEDRYKTHYRVLVPKVFS